MRKIVQGFTNENSVYLICDDGSFWGFDEVDKTYVRLPDIPTPEHTHIRFQRYNGEHEKRLLKLLKGSPGAEKFKASMLSEMKRALAEKDMYCETSTEPGTELESFKDLAKKMYKNLIGEN